MLNPAAAGLIVSFHLFDSGHSWWGALPDVSPWWMLLIFALGAIMARRLHKETAVVVFLGVWTRARRSPRSSAIRCLSWSSSAHPS